jgi:hypothetical protein
MSEEDRVIEVSVRVRLGDVLVGEKDSLMFAQNRTQKNREREERRVVKAETGRRGREESEKAIAHIH